MTLRVEERIGRGRGGVRVKFHLIVESLRLLLANDTHGILYTKKLGDFFNFTAIFFFFFFFFILRLLASPSLPTISPGTYPVIIRQRRRGIEFSSVEGV